MKTVFLRQEKQGIFDRMKAFLRRLQCIANQVSAQCTVDFVKVEFDVRSCMKVHFGTSTFAVVMVRLVVYA